MEFHRKIRIMKTPEDFQKEFPHRSVSFREIGGGLVAIEIDNQVATARIAAHGAHVMDFQPKSEQPVLWMSGNSWFEEWKPIRGGVPVCWPWFGGHPSDDTKPSHGFARLAEWDIADITELSPDRTRVVLTLTDSDRTRELWNYQFELKMTVVIGQTLDMCLSVQNRSDRPFVITAALHSYFNISEISSISIRGLETVEFIDTLDDSRHVQQGPISFLSETDRVYVNTAADCFIDDPGLDRTVRISKAGSNTTVVWNPWFDKSKRMPDFGDDEFPGMVCVETTNAPSDEILVRPGDIHLLQAVISVEKLEDGKSQETQ